MLNDEFPTDSGPCVVRFEAQIPDDATGFQITIRLGLFLGLGSWRVWTDNGALDERGSKPVCLQAMTNYLQTHLKAWS